MCAVDACAIHAVAGQSPDQLRLHGRCRGQGDHDARIAVPAALAEQQGGVDLEPLAAIVGFTDRGFDAGGAAQHVDHPNQVGAHPGLAAAQGRQAGIDEAFLQGAQVMAAQRQVIGEIAGIGGKAVRVPRPVRDETLVRLLADAREQRGQFLQQVVLFPVGDVGSLHEHVG